MAIEANETSLLELIIKAKDKPVIIDFFASWCGPCQMFGPIFADVSEQEKDNAFFAKVNVDENQEVAQKYNVTSIPTIIVLKKSQEMARHSGFIDAKGLKDLYQKYI